MSYCDILRYLKIGNNKSDERTSTLIDEMICVFKESITPKSIYAIYDCKVETESVALGEMTISSTDLAKHLGSCSRAVMFAATLGASADTLIRKYSVQDMEKSLIAQSVCNDMIETYCDEIEKEFSQSAELEGLFPVTRYSPGYGDFDITCQKDILKLLDASRIGLSLTDGYMLIPSKSVTAVIGFSEKQNSTAGCPENLTAKCASCEDKNCVYRGAKQ